jgi:hypothetical protein
MTLFTKYQRSRTLKNLHEPSSEKSSAAKYEEYHVKKLLFCLKTHFFTAEYLALNKTRGLQLLL